MKTIVKHTYVHMAGNIKCITITSILALFLPFYSAQASVLTNLSAFGNGTECEGSTCLSVRITGNLSYLDPNPNQFDVLQLASNSIISPDLMTLNLNIVAMGSSSSLDSLSYPYPDPSNVVHDLTLTEGPNLVQLTAFTHQNPLVPSDHADWTISFDPNNPLPELFVWNNNHGQDVRGTIRFVPEPSSILLLGFGLLGFMAWRRRKTA